MAETTRADPAKPDAAPTPTQPPAQAPGAPAKPVDPGAQLRSSGYRALLILAALIGVPVSAAAYFFLQLVTAMQRWLFTDAPRRMGFSSTPNWWLLVLLVVAGLIVGPVIRYLPGGGGHSPVDGFGHGKPIRPIDLPGVVIAALATLSFGVVLGPEAPLIALGAGLGALAVKLAKKDAPPRVATVMASAGSFAAISALLGSPLLGAFLLMEVAGIGGATMELVLLPGLLAAGVGSLIFIGLDSLTGLGTTSLALPNLPHFARPDIAEFGWALLIGVLAVLLGSIIRIGATALRGLVAPRIVWAASIVGLAIAGLAIAYTTSTDKPYSDVLFSGQTDMGPLIQHSASYSVLVLLMLLLCKGVAYALSMSSFRGGPVFPSMFMGAAGGIAMSHLPGLPLVPAVAMGIGAMCAVMLRLPLTSVLLATLLLTSDGLAVMPLVIVSVVVAYVLAASFEPDHLRKRLRRGS